MNVDIPVPGGGLRTFLSLILFLQQFRVMSLVAGQVGARVPAHSSSWTPAAYEVPSGSVEWVELFDDDKSKTYLLLEQTYPTDRLAAASGYRGRLGWYSLAQGRVSTYDLPPLPPD